RPGLRTLLRKTPDSSGVFCFIRQDCHGVHVPRASLLHNSIVDHLFSGIIMATAAAPRIKAGIVGGTGYTGVELLRLLSQHPNVELAAITSRKEDGMPVAQMFPNLRGRVALAFQTPEK